MNTKNILLIGRTGSGKSTIANILFNKVNQEGKFIDFQEIFAEGAGSTSQTRTIQEVKVTINSNEYNLIDTIGFGDTDSKLDPHKVLAELKEKLQELAELSQVFFVFKDKFTPEDVQTYKYLYHDVFNNDKEINKFITVVRTRFDNFEDEIECKTDKEGTIGEGGEVGKIISMCRDLIHVNNPPLNIAKKKEANLEERSLSRKKITDHLIKYQGNYEIKLDKKQESKPNSNFSGSTFYGNVYSEISTGDYANFGTIGVKNFGNIQTQQNHSYLNEEVKKNKQKEKLSTSENNSSINVLRSEIPPQSTSAEKNLTTGIAQIINLGNISKKEENNRSFGHQKRVSIMSVSDFEEINAISAEDLPANVYQLTLNFLKAKEYFYLTRQRTVNNLKIQIQELESRIGKLNNIGSVAELVINLGSFTRSLDQGITTAIGKGAKMSSEALSSNYISKQGKQIHLIFQNSEEEKNNLQQLDFAYSQLNNSLQGNKEYDLFGLLDSRHHRAFKVDYKIYDILEHQINIWPDRKLNEKILEQIYTSLQTNLTELDKEINLEFLKLKPVDQAEIRKDNKIRDLTEQITDKEKELKLITSRLKVILRSRSSSAANKEEREKKLTELFDDLPKNSQEFIDSLEKIKPELSKKVEKQEIEKLYQVNKELNELERVKDETLQTQIEIPAK